MSPPYYGRRELSAVGGGGDGGPPSAEARARGLVCPRDAGVAGGPDVAVCTTAARSVPSAEEVMAYQFCPLVPGGGGGVCPRGSGVRCSSRCRRPTRRRPDAFRWKRR